MGKLSVVVPCFNEQDTVPLMYQALVEVAAHMQASVVFEFVFVDDGSSDGTLDVVRRLHDADDRVQYVSFSRNFGKEAAMTAGLRKATGDYITIMDADLQDPPDLLPAMLAGIVEDGYDCVAARRVSRDKKTPLSSFLASYFYKLFRHLSGVVIADGARDYRLMTRQVVEAVLALPERDRFIKGIFGWVGFRTKWLSYEHVERAAGESKWPLRSLFRYSIDGILAFSNKPLGLAPLAGSLFCLIALILLVVWLVCGAVGVFPALMLPLLAALFFIGGVQLLCMGLIGQYLARTYREAQGRPTYLIREESDPVS